MKGKYFQTNKLRENEQPSEINPACGNTAVRAAMGQKQHKHKPETLLSELIHLVHNTEIRHEGHQRDLYITPLKQLEPGGSIN